MKTQKPLPEPSWLPPIIVLNFRYLVAEELLNENEKALFTDKRLSTFWKNADNYLSNLPANHLNNAASFLVGSFLVPLKLYGKTGTVDRPSIKTEIRARQSKADDLMQKAAEQAKMLSDTLQELEKTSNYIPCATRLTDIVSTLTDELKTKELPSCLGGVRTYEVIDLLEKSLREWPNASNVFNAVPGMKSNKSSERDWVRESQANVAHMLRMCPGELNIRETDWVILAKVLIDEGVTRESVRDALRT